MCLAVMHTPRGSEVGSAARQLCPDLGAPLTTASACPSGPAGDGADSSGPPHAHPGAPSNRHVHAGEVSWSSQDPGATTGQEEEGGDGMGRRGVYSDSPRQCYWNL